MEKRFPIAGLREIARFYGRARRASCRSFRGIELAWEAYARRTTAPGNIPPARRAKPAESVLENQNGCSTPDFPTQRNPLRLFDAASLEHSVSAMIRFLRPAGSAKPQPDLIRTSPQSCRIRRPAKLRHARQSGLDRLQQVRS
jgi:hypothetical protein